MAGHGRMSRAGVLAVVNDKGGVGKTTVAVNLAAALAEAAEDVLLVELDSQHDDGTVWVWDFEVQPLE